MSTRKKQKAKPPEPAKMTRKIPATMATQHPDHANVPFWKRNGDAFVHAQEEVEECFGAFQDLECQEYMWDWEGKYVDEAVVDKLFSNHFEFFSKTRLGRDAFLTFRLPNIWLEKGYRLARAYMGILTFEDLSRDLGHTTPPVFEVILPMTDEAQKLIHLQRTFDQVAKLKYRVFGQEREFGRLRVIPLIEGMQELTATRKILDDYMKLYEDEYHERLDYLRPFVARSDPSLNNGLIAATIAAKVALSEHYRFQDDTGIAVHPIIGVGCLPFRGGLSPHRLKEFLTEYRGVRTVTVQSAFRYDYDYEEVKRAIAYLNHALAEGRPTPYTSQQVKQGEQLCTLFGDIYQKTIEQLAPMVNEVAQAIPQRRERLLHFGLFGYARGVRGIRLPRAIGFTAALYSFGIPPELIGAGRGLRLAAKKGLSNLVELFYTNVRRDLIEAGTYLNKENLRFLIERSSAWRDVQEDIKAVESFLGEELGPREPEHFLHRNFASNSYFLWHAGRDFSEPVLEAAKLRRSLG
ncbi:MAG: phosphoenolpyruvate carboxylase [Nitrospirota bacterium]